MDGAIHALRALDEHRLADVKELCEWFAVAGAAQVYVAFDPKATREVTAEAAATGYRVVVEAPPNVRRHAPDATRVNVKTE
jgi:signal transduction histidine kinase